jgi:hypothetical protein
MSNAPHLRSSNVRCFFLSIILPAYFLRESNDQSSFAILEDPRVFFTVNEIYVFGQRYYDGVSTAYSYWIENVCYSGTVLIN